jgi:hypothetical protein
MSIAADMCIYTNHNFVIETISTSPPAQEGGGGSGGGAQP